MSGDAEVNRDREIKRETVPQISQQTVWQLQYIKCTNVAPKAPSVGGFYLGMGSVAMSVSSNQNSFRMHHISTCASDFC